jgi:dipeptidyl aminopeptidase/acylaminoacyl peptidase
MSESGRPITFGDLIGLGRITEVTIAPGSERLVFEVAWHQTTSNKIVKELWSMPADGSGEPRPLVRGPHSNGAPRFSPDGRTLAFLSDRSGSRQVWLLPVEGGEAARLTDLPFDVGGPYFTPDGRWLLVTGAVDPRASLDRPEATSDRPPPAAGPRPRHERSLLFRHWNSWRDGKRSHLFAVSLANGSVRDLTPGDRDVPPISLGGSRDYDVSPDMGEFAIARNDDPEVALSTSNSIVIKQWPGADERHLTAERGCESNPRYAPDGSALAFLGMSRPGYEADRCELHLVDLATGRARSVTAELDLSVDNFAWSPDSRQIFFEAGERGRKSIWKVAVGGSPERLTSGAYDELKAVATDGSYLILSRQSAAGPADLHRFDLTSGRLSQLTRFNEERLAGVAMNPAEDFEYAAEDGTRIHGLLVRPPGWEPGRRYPLLYLIHGGPQSAFADQFHYRWNPQLFAAPGYVVAMVNPRGSTGYGQVFADQIQNDWGGRCYSDLMLGVDHLLTTHDFIDGERVAAAGASFGGYMVNWIEGHTDRFRALVCHAGIFNLESFYYGTEELWFPHWEFEGSPPENPEAYARWSPDRFIADFRTPMLVLHGELDYRCPVLGGIGMFTALQVKGVPSEFVYFPDEGHWIEKPRNAEAWYSAILDWLARWLGASESDELAR